MIGSEDRIERCKQAYVDGTLSLEQQEHVIEGQLSGWEPAWLSDRLRESFEEARKRAGARLVSAPFPQPARK